MRRLGLREDLWWIAGTAVAVAVALVFAGITFVVSANRGPAVSQRQLEQLRAAEKSADEADAAARPKQVAFLGDSYSGGSEMDSGEASRWPHLTSLALHWVPRYFTVGGSGYIAAGQDQPFGARVESIIQAKPDIVVVSGGINDLQVHSADDIGDAALKVFRRLRAGLPKADIVVVGIFVPRKVGDPSVTRVRDAIHQAQQSVPNTRWIDPLPWIAKGKVEIGRDGTHPTDKGHKAIADDMTSALRKLGYGPSA